MYPRAYFSDRTVTCSSFLYILEKNLGSYYRAVKSDCSQNSVYLCFHRTRAEARVAVPAVYRFPI